MMSSPAEAKILQPPARSLSKAASPFFGNLLMPVVRGPLRLQDFRFSRGAPSENDELLLTLLHWVQTQDLAIANSTVLHGVQTSEVVLLPAGHRHVLLLGDEAVAA